MPCSKCGGVLGCVCPPATPESEPPPKCAECGHLESRHDAKGGACNACGSAGGSLRCPRFVRPVAPPHEHPKDGGVWCTSCGGVYYHSSGCEIGEAHSEVHPRRPSPAPVEAEPSAKDLLDDFRLACRGVSANVQEEEADIAAARAALVERFDQQDAEIARQAELLQIATGELAATVEELRAADRDRSRLRAQLENLPTPEEARALYAVYMDNAALINYPTLEKLRRQAGSEE